MAERMDWHYIYKSSDRLPTEKLHHTPSCAVSLYFSKFTSCQYMRGWSDKCTLPILGSLYSSVINQFRFHCTVIPLPT